MAQEKKPTVKRAAKKTSSSTVKKEEQKLESKDLATLRPIEAPRFMAGSVLIHNTGNDVVLAFGQPVPLQNMTTLEPVRGAMLNQTVAIVSISPQTAKDMLLVLTSSIEKHEAKYGEIVTPHTQKLAAENVKRKKNR